jgi:hypothetical protein
MFAAASFADQLKEACVRQMAAEIQSVKEDAMIRHLLSLAAPQQHRELGQAEQQQQQEQLEQALAEYRQVKEGCGADDPGTYRI